MGTYQPLTYTQMKAILQANNMNLVRFRSATHDCDVFDIVDAANSIVKGDCGLMDVEMFIEQRGLRLATSTKETILLRSGERIQRKIRDLDFMHLCDGRQYARCTYNGEEIEISRKRNENGDGIGEWQENSTAIGIIAIESAESDVNTERLTIQVRCTSCQEVKPATIIAESLDSDYTLNEDGETYTSLYGECAECLAGESSEDRLERQAQAHLEAAALHRDDPMF